MGYLGFCTHLATASALAIAWLNAWPLPLLWAEAWAWASTLDTEPQPPEATADARAAEKASALPPPEVRACRDRWVTEHTSAV